MLLKAKAKINLFLHINGKLPNAYHLLDSLAVFAEDIYDEIEIFPGDKNCTAVVGGEFGFLLKQDKNNLIDQALKLFTKDKFYHCKLKKHIPLEAGLGGGSSDAAVVARFLDKAIPNEDLAKIGADLPICYNAKPCYFSGIGDIIEPLECFPSCYLVIVNPKKSLLTQDVFLQNKKIYTPFIGNKPTVFTKFENLIDFLLSVDNVLTDAAKALMPEISDILEELALQDNCALSRMSGSGPTCFGVFEEQNKALAALNNIKVSFPDYWIRHTKIGA